MSTSIEQRVVQMRFDNKQFEAGVAQSMSTLDKFRAKLNFKGAAKGFDDINRAAAKVSLQPMTDQIDRVGIKFDGLAVVAATALSRITNAAISTGKNMVKALTLDPVTTGFREYETKLNSIQTIMSNTASKGTTMEQITEVLDDLNTYADKTIYNYAEMTRNIGLFTAAGVDLIPAAESIKGISNLAASVGTNAADTARVMYQLSQALSSGAVRLQDWRSLESAGGMAGEKFQEALKKTAREQGIAVDQMIEKNGNFRESLKEGWLSTEVLNTTLRKFTVEGAKEYAKAMMDSGKYTQAQADALIAEAQAMEDAATKVKTFTQLWSTLQEAAQSGWGKSWEIIVGDFEEAKDLFTNISNVIGGFIDASADARNEMLQGWKDLGGRTAFIKTLSKAFENFTNVVGALSNAFRDIFPRITAKQLFDITLAIKNFVYGLTFSEEAINTLRVAFKALLLPVQAVVQVVRIGATALGAFIQACFKLVDALLALPSKIGKVDDPFKKLFGSERYERLSKALSTLAEGFGHILDKGRQISGVFNKMLRSGILGFFEKLGEIIEPFGEWILDRVVEGFEALTKIDFKGFGDMGFDALTTLVAGFSNISDICGSAINAISDFFSRFRIMSPAEVLNGIAGAIQNIFNGIVGFFKGVDISPVVNPVVEKFNFLRDIIMKVATAISEFTGKLTAAKILIFGFGVSLIAFIFKLTSVLDQFAEVATGLGKLLTGAGGVLNSTSRLIWALSERVKGDKFARNIIPISVAITLLATSLIILSNVNPEGLKQATISIALLMVSFGGLIAIVGAVNKFLTKTPEMAKNLQLIGVSMLAMAGSVAILSGALWILSKVDMTGMGIKLIALVLLMGTMVLAIDSLGHYAGDSLGKAAVILAFAGAMALIVHSIAKISKEDITLSANAVIALVTIIIMLKRLAKSVDGVKFTGGAGMVLLVLSLGIFARTLSKLSKYDTGELLLGLINFIPIFVTLKLLSNVIGSGKEVAKLGGQVLAISISILILQKAIEKLGGMDLAVLVKGGIVVGALIVIFGLMQRLANISGHGTVKMKGSFIAIALAILILGLAISYIGKLDLKTVAQGTIVVAALLLFLTSLAEAIGPAQKSTKSIIAITVTLSLLIASIALLTLIDPKELMASSVGLSLAMLALGQMFKMLNGRDFKPKNAVGPILSLLAVVTILGVAFYKLNDLNPQTALANAGAISAVLVALGGSMKLFRITTGKPANIAKSLGAILAMLTMATVVIGVLGALDIGPGILEKAAALSLVLAALGGISFLIGKTNLNAKGAASGAAAIAAVTGIIGALVLAIGGFSMIPGFNEVLGKGSETINSLRNVIPMLGVFTAITFACEALGLGGIRAAGVAASGALAIDAVIVLLTAVVAGIGAFFTAFPDADGWLNKAIEVFPKIGVALGSLLGGFGSGLVSGAASGVMVGLTALAEGFANFMDKIGPFFEGLDQITADKVTAVSSLGTMILALTAADILQAINPFISGNPLGALADNLVDFGPDFATFADSIKNIDAEKVNAFSNCLNALANVLVHVPTEGGIMSWFVGEKDIKGFGEGMKNFAEGFAEFAKTIDSSELSQDSVDKVKYAMTALTDMANTIPTSGGLLEGFFGGKDMATFGTQLKDYATGLMGFFKIISGQDSEVGAVAVDFDLVTKCANAGKALADFASNIPSTGGHLQKITGIKDMAAFGTQLEGYAKGLVGFFNVLNGKNTEAGAVDIDKVLVDKATYAGEAFAGLAEQLPGTGGVWQAFAGSVDLETFGNGIGKFGQGLYDFFDKFKSAAITDEDVTTAKNAGEAFKELVNNVKPNEGAVTWFESVNLETYGGQLKGFGEGVKGFYDAISAVDFTLVDNAVASIKSILGLQTEMEDISTTGAINFRTYLTKLGEVGLADFATTFANGEEQLKTSIETTLISALESASASAGVDDIDVSTIFGAIITAVANKKTVVSDLAGDVIGWFKEAFELKKTVFESCGATIIESLYTGANTKFTEYTAKFEELATSIVSSFSKGFNIVGSISLEFQSIGKYCIAGFIKGFESEAAMASSRVQTIANNLTVATENALGVNSPSTKFAEIGMYCIQGLINGIDDNTKYATDKAVKMGKNLLESVKQFFGIKSPSTVMRDEVGRYIVEGIAEGISKNTSAEEAAAQKAQNIVNAFKTEFDKLDRVLSTANLEFELWQAMNPNATENQTNVEQIKMIDKSMKAQAERVSTANAQYQATLQSLGENAAETQEAYNAYLEEKISLAELAQQLGTLQSANGRAFRKFDELMRNSYEKLKAYGMTDEEIRQYALDESGWQDPMDPNTTVTPRGSIESIMNSYMEMTKAGSEQAEVIIRETVSNAITESTQAGIPVARNSGKQIVQSFNEGANEAVEETSKSGNFVDKAIESIKNSATENGQNVSTGFFEGLVNSASEGIGTFGTEAVNKLSEFIPMLNQATGCQSPSAYTYETGRNVVQGFLNGLTEGSPLIASTASESGSQALTAFKNQIPQYPSIGNQMMAGLANGIRAGMSAVTSAASAVAQMALSATRSILEIKSPSREYYKIGEYMDQGLANGIIDNASVITDSISTVLSKAQKEINNNQLYVRPVRTGRGGGHWSKQGLWVSADTKYKPEDNSQLLQWDASGNLIPVGYGHSGNKEGSSWAIAPSYEVAQAIRRFGDKEAEAALRANANAGLYEGTYRELQDLIKKVEENPSVVYNQTINSPKNVNAADVQRATNMQLSPLKAQNNGFYTPKKITEIDPKKKLYF